MWFIDGLLTVFLAICSAVLCEGVSWLMMYSKERYRKSNFEIQKQSNRLMRLKSSGNPEIDARLKKRMNKEQQRLTRNVILQLRIHVQTLLVVWITVAVLLIIFNALCDGWVAAKVQCLPLSWIFGVTNHVPGNGYYDLVYIFAFLLCLQLCCYIFQESLGYAKSVAAATAKIRAVRSMFY